ncbi:MAG: hypothetical protein A4E19_19370 [Nitrospira sp. SG-bin1]|nr:MAG: hypothetical protein A4E19_19370 [Nitrospira sp. SG-bin1]
MKTTIISSTVATNPVKKLSSTNPWELARRLFMFKAERWKRRAMFYERHRDYFPRLAMSRFIDRCRELEAMYRQFVTIMFHMPLQEQLVPVRKKQEQRTPLSRRLAVLASRQEL